MRAHVVRAVFWRNFVSYFTSPTAYIFIVLFIWLCVWGAIVHEPFFANSLANLAPLNALFPYFLLFFIPTITMSTWAEERRQGTDELLLTLPVRDVELVAGKYLSALGIYTVSLFFSLSLILVVGSLGSPDFGVMLGTYAGYWLLGATLISIGMVGSLLTGSMTVAFILGAVFCLVVVVLLRSVGLDAWGAIEAFADISRGVVSMRALAYFGGLTAAALYLNLVLLARRHISGGPDSALAWVHFGARAACTFVAAASLTVLCGRYGTRVDITSERLYSLTRETRELVWKIDPANPVYVHAYVSPEVPRDYAETRENLIALLREYASLGGDRIQLQIIDTNRYSPEAREADEKFGIKPTDVLREEAGRRTTARVFLGVAMTCGAEETVIPFMHRGFSIEYELTRSLGVATGARRKRVGIATTDAKLFGGMNFETFSQTPSWEIVDELKKQYEVFEVSLDQPVAEKMDVLLVAMPSSLTQPQMNHLLAHIRQGGAALLCDDPMPLFNPGLAPHEPKRGAGRGGPFGPPPSNEKKGDIEKLLQTLGLSWPSETVVWDTYNPHPQWQEIPREIMFIGPGSGAEAFNPNHAVSGGLQESVFLCAGQVLPHAGRPLTFTPLVRTTRKGGSLQASECFSRMFGGWNQDRKHVPSNMDYVLAAHVKGTAPAPEPPKDGSPAPPADTIHVVFVADVDLISNQFFEFRRRGEGDMHFDNITFILNCVDVLAGDESFVTIRKRRPKHRTLEELERRLKEHRDKQLNETKKAEDEAKKKLDEANARLQAKLDEYKKRTDLDEQTKEIMLENLQQVEQRRLDVAKKEIEDEKQAAIERSKATVEEAVSDIQGKVKLISFLVAPLPALFVGLLVLVFRKGSEGGTA